MHMHIPCTSASLALIVSAGLASCALTGGPTSPTTLEEIERAGNVIIFRANAEPTAWPVTIKVNGKNAGVLRNKEYVGIYIEPDHADIEISWPILAGQSGLRKRFAVRNDGTLYLEVRGTSVTTGSTEETLKFRTRGELVVGEVDESKLRILECCKQAY